MAAEIIDLGRRIVAQAETQGATVRLLGGVAVGIRCADILLDNPSLVRAYPDIDLAAYSRERKTVEAMLLDFGFRGVTEFNYLAAGRRLMYVRDADKLRVDVFLDEFRMCHRLPLLNRLEMTSLTLNLTDLLLTKLQIVQPSGRDAIDLCALLLASSVTSSPWQQYSDGLEASRVTEICSRSWGWHTTVLYSLRWVEESARPLLDRDVCETVVGEARALARRIQETPKTLGWKMRALIGERLTWYETPETIEPSHVG